MVEEKKEDFKLSEDEINLARERVDEIHPL
jgi:hypothetical protein